MRRITRSALVRYSAEDMFRLVGDVESYPEFVPWCEKAEVLERGSNTVTASLGFARGGLHKSFTTRNHMEPSERIELALVEGPFRSLRGEWSFSPLGEGGSKVSLDIKFEFDSRIADVVIGPFFQEICNRLVDAFSKRANEVYGERHEPRAG